MVAMWMIVLVVWRMLTKLLRRTGRWLLPLLLAVLLALVLTGRRPANTAGLLPVSMLAAGICGLWTIASLAGKYGQVNVFTNWTAGVQRIAGPGRFTLPTPAGSGAHAFHTAPGGPPAGNFQAVVPRARVPNVVVRGYRVVPGHVLWSGRLLLLGSLLLLAIGLWLAPRAVADLREQYSRVPPRLRRWVREGNWGILLVPVTCFGLTVFGVRPWTIAVIVAAIVISIRWPRLAADLVPLVLVVFAVYGFMLVSRWVPGPRMGGPNLMPVRFGAVAVDSSSSSLLAGIEASMLLAFGAWLFPRTVGAHARRGASGQEAELAGRVQRLTETRDKAADAATAELRRIERDLHDGAQARLVALGMNLRALERMLPGGSPDAQALVAEARETSLRALNDLRHLIRGICPPVLADRGLAHAVQALALDTPLPVDVDVDLPGRLTAPVESACYFAIAEVLANAVKHAGARRVHIRIQHAARVLRIEVTDDGAGGANPAAGTGLRGVEQRLGTFDGIVAVSSPPGGPTIVAMEVPCALSSPKTCSC